MTDQLKLTLDGNVSVTPARPLTERQTLALGHMVRPAHRGDPVLRTRSCAGARGDGAA